MAKNPIPRLVATRLARWNQLHPNHQVDLKALEAVGRQEGYSGGIGDNGHAFGPFQLNNAGGVITGMFPGQSPQQIQQWATSPQGIDFALNRIAPVAGGLRGPAAVRAIVTRFERPADPSGETARALAAYGQAPPAEPLTAGGVQPLPYRGGGLNVQPLPTQPGVRPQVNLLGALGQSAQTGDYSGFYQALTKASQQPLPAQRPVSAGRVPDLRVHGTVAAEAVAGGTQLGQSIAKTALTQLGTPYQYGGLAKLGSRTDCSGLLQASAAAHGIRISRTTYDQWKEGSAVPRGKLQAGDAVFFRGSDARGNLPGHVGIYIGNGKFVEDPHTGGTVQISTLAGRGDYVGARRYG